MRHLLAWLILALAALPARAATLEFALADAEGLQHRLSDFGDRRLVVVAFLGSECPLARLYAHRLNDVAARYGSRVVGLLAINANAGDSASAVRAFAAKHACAFPILLDPEQRVADLFGATRQLEVFVLDQQREVRYHGRVDDQYGPGTRRPAPLRDDLVVALDELLAGRPVSVVSTPLAGCFIERAEPAGKAASEPDVVTYERQIGPLLAKHCVECHRPGEIGPFSLTSYESAVAWADTIRERVAENKMPPWHADRRFGHFANERRFTDEEKRLLFAWIDGERLRGQPAVIPRADSREDAATSPRDSAAPSAWQIGRPDKIVTMPRPARIPAHGTLDYQVIEVRPGFTEDTWIRAAEVRPGRREVVHHVTVFIAPPGQEHADDEMHGIVFFAAYVPGMTPLVLPAGMARKIPAGWSIYFQMHYVPNGTETTDQTSLGLLFADSVREPVWTSLLLVKDFSLKPFADHQRLEQSWTVPTDIRLLSLMPHMHLRGKSFRYEAQYADGRRETLLDVPRFDIMWQHQYVLAEPKLLPAGTLLRAEAEYDNSPANPNNPDPAATVRCGLQTTDEMFNGWFTFATVESQTPRRGDWLPWTALAIAGIWLFERRRQNSKD